MKCRFPLHQSATATAGPAHDWSIDSDHELAKLVARIALGQYRHVLQILSETDFASSAPATTALAGARQLLTVPDGSDPFHRDGWLFQTISWIAAHIQDNTALIAPPHMQHADKGFDGLHVLIDEKTQTVRSVVICEDKATSNPRDTIRDLVWKEFSDLEAGSSDHLLTAEVSTLLATRLHSTQIRRFNKFSGRKCGHSALQ